MSVAELSGFIPARTMPNGAVFHSPLGVFGFQAEGLAEAYIRTEPDSDGGIIAVWDWGLGKTHLGMALASYLFEDGRIDQVMVVCERNKISEWQSDFEKFTALSTLRHHDSGRQKRLERHGVPHVLITTYETGRDDLMRRVKKANTRGKGSAMDGPLIEALGLRGKRTLWIFDEPIKFRNRSSALYQAYEYILKQLRKTAHQRVLGLTATPMETHIGQAFNIARLVAPQTQPSVGDFKKQFVAGYDPFGNERYDGRAQVYAHVYFQPLIIRKRKTDPDVIDQFPKLIEEARYVPMNKVHRDFYNAVLTMLDPPEGQDDPRDEDQIVDDEIRIHRLLRMTAGHPASHLHVPNELSRRIVETVTAEGLRAIPSSKSADLIERFGPIIKGQGAQVLVFEFFTSVIRELVRELRKAGFTVGEYHGGVPDRDRERDKQAFKDGALEILVLSDAGARGINLGEASYVIEYSPSTTYAMRSQRGNRANRIDSDSPSTTFTTMVLDGTVEERIFDRALKRNQDHDTLLGDTEDDTGFVSAAERRAILGAYRLRREGRSPRKDAA